MSGVQLKRSAYALDAGVFKLDGGAMFGLIPKSIWGAFAQADENNRVSLVMRLLLFRRASDDAWCLIDAGAGTRLTPKDAEIYSFEISRDPLADSLAALGLKKTDIAAVLMSHLHFDHAGGLVEKTADGALVPAFPNALHIMHERQWTYAHAPALRDRGSYRQDDFAPLASAVEMRLLKDEEASLFDGQVSAYALNGHSPGMLVFDVRTADQPMTLSFCADLIPSSYHVRLHYGMAFDNEPLVAMEDKRRMYALWDDAQLQNHWLFFEHDPQCICAQIERPIVTSGKEKIRRAAASMEALWQK